MNAIPASLAFLDAFGGPENGGLRPKTTSVSETPATGPDEGATAAGGTASGAPGSGLGGRRR